MIASPDASRYVYRLSRQRRWAPVLRTIAVLAVAVALPASAMAAGQAPLRIPPGNVPAAYVPTPFGWFHPSCVVAIGNDEVVNRQLGRIERRDGGTRTVPACAHARYDRRGKLVSASESPPPTANGWLASLQTPALATAPAVDWVEARWTVPDSPATGGATVYFFPGIEPLPNATHILQPVLGYNHYVSPPNNTWSIASWDCCTLGGNASHSPFITVHPGQQIYGIMTGANCDTGGVCGTWTVTTSAPSGYSTTYTATGNTQVMNWVFAGALETYFVDSCTQLPTSNSVTFTSVAVQALNPLRWLTPQLTPVVSSSVTPNCSVSATAQPGSVSSATIRWQACAPGWGQACSGQCGSGTVLCDGSCSAWTPEWVGQQCPSARCMCAEVWFDSPGTYDCAGNCLMPADWCLNYCTTSGGG